MSAIWIDAQLSPDIAAFLLAEFGAHTFANGELLVYIF